MKKRGSKENEIEFPQIEMAQYLLPNKYLTIDKQRQLFALRNIILDIPSNFQQKKTICQNVSVNKRKICNIFIFVNI